MSCDSLSLSLSGPPAEPSLPSAHPSGGSAEGAAGEAGPEHGHEAQPVPQQEAQTAEEDDHGGPQRNEPEEVPPNDAIHRLGA